MKKLLLAILLLLPFVGFSQYKWEFGGNLGAANYLGEMGGKEKTRRDFIADIKLGKSRTNFGGFVRYKQKQWLYFRAALQYCRVAGADSSSTNPGRVGRNLSFRNDIFDLSVDAEYCFYHPNDISRIGKKRVDFQSYVFGGVGMFYSNPKAKYQGDWYALQPLQTEGIKYKKLNLMLPAGVGMKYTIGRKWKFGAEFAYRFTFTDYIDDASTSYPASGVLTDPLAIALSNRNGELSSATKDKVTDLPSSSNYGPPSDKQPKLNKRGDPTHDDVYMFLTLIPLLSNN